MKYLNAAEVKSWSGKIGVLHVSCYKVDDHYSIVAHNGVIGIGIGDCHYNVEYNAHGVSYNQAERFIDFIAREQGVA